MGGKTVLLAVIDREVCGVHTRKSVVSQDKNRKVCLNT